MKRPRRAAAFQHVPALTDLRELPRIRAYFPRFRRALARRTPEHGKLRPFVVCAVTVFRKNPRFISPLDAFGTGGYLGAAGDATGSLSGSLRLDNYEVNEFTGRGHGGHAPRVLMRARRGRGASRAATVRFPHDCAAAITCDASA
ncbi:hypothetical protein [Paraburkholderia youngii]|uniref:hypothetical protein n=1 Tax=Paraburkholderia youngii TaxID=2782701 RepID=UPI00159277C5|nr:hypothetical protein [Paraburkholderia youngii]NUX52395.1 hypothetical protein [Paraburkholderia youngii]